MKRIVAILALLISVNYGFSHGNHEGMKFFHGTYKELLKEAKKQNKKIFIDFYTKWCGPCRAIAQNVFPQKQVGEFYNKHFINYKVDAEVGEGPMLAKKYKVKGFPTFIYANNKGESIYEGSSIGASDAKGFIRLAKLALGIEKKDWAWYQAEYKKGTRNPKFLNGYINAQLAAKSMPPSIDLLFELYKSYPKAEQFKGNALKMCFWKAEVGNKFYDILIKNKEKFTQFYNPKDMVGWFNQQMIQAFMMKKEYKNIYTDLKKEFPKYAKQALEFFNIDRLRFENKEAQFVPKLYAYKQKYGEPHGYSFSIGFPAISIKKLNPEIAKDLIKYYEEGVNSNPPHFHSVATYGYLLYKSGQKKKAYAHARRFVETTKKYSKGRKSAWAYNTMKALEKRKAPKPFSRK